MALRPPVSIKERFARKWGGFAAFFIDYVFDLAVGLLVFAGFLLFAWICGLARAMGVVSQEHLVAYERAHFWLNYALYVIMGLMFLFRAVTQLFRGD